MTGVLLTEARIQTRVAALGEELRRAYPGDLHLVAVLNGACVFLADLMRAIPGDLSIDFLTVSSYGNGTTSSNAVRLLKDLTHSIEGRDVVLVEDIVDTGFTLSAMRDWLQQGNPHSLATVALLDKPTRRRVPVPVEFVGFTIEDRFVVGYGLDYAGRYRNLRHVAVLM